MRLASLIMLFVFVSCSNMPSMKDPLTAVSEKPVETLAYSKEDLPTSYHQLIKTEGNISQLTEAFKGAKDNPGFRFSLAVIIYEKTSMEMSEQIQTEAQTFFQLALQDEHEWVKSKAAWGLSRVGTMNDFASLIQVMQSGDEWMQQDVHAALSFIRARSTDGQARRPASSDENMSFHDTAYWTRWWKKNAK